MFTIYHGNEIMKANNEGYIYRPAIGMNQPSKQWKLTGAVRYNNFGSPVEYFSLTDLKLEKVQWKYKNGKQRIHASDWDHGTNRVWMSPKHNIVFEP